jgi:hypothetical protein
MGRVKRKGKTKGKDLCEKQILLLRSVNLNHEKGEVSYPPTVVPATQHDFSCPKNTFFCPKCDCILHWAILKLNKGLGF